MQFPDICRQINRAELHLASAHRSAHGTYVHSRGPAYSQRFERAQDLATRMPEFYTRAMDTGTVCLETVSAIWTAIKRDDRLEQLLNRHYDAAILTDVTRYGLDLSIECDEAVQGRLLQWMDGFGDHPMGAPDAKDTTLSAVHRWIDSLADQGDTAA